MVNYLLWNKNTCKLIKKTLKACIFYYILFLYNNNDKLFILQQKESLRIKFLEKY